MLKLVLLFVRQHEGWRLCCAAVMCRAVGCVCIAGARARPVAHQHTGVTLGFGHVQTQSGTGGQWLLLQLLPYTTLPTLCIVTAPPNLQVLPPTVDANKLPLGSNTLLVPQVDYNDVLGHTNARVFVSHCGLHSVYEAAYHGVPVVGVPFMFEQVRHVSFWIRFLISGGSVSASARVEVTVWLLVSIYRRTELRRHSRACC
jgi:hypothetical protein